MKFNKEKFGRHVNKAFHTRHNVEGMLYSSMPKEVPIGAVIGSVAFGLASYTHENDKAGQIPLAFSEIGRIKKSFQQKGEAVPPLTRYYGSTNDVCMKVFEANNIAHEEYFRFTNKSFAQELEYKTDPAYKVHHLIGEYAAEYPGLSEGALESLSNIDGASRDIAAINQAFDKAWNEHHRDVHVPSMCASLDSKGNVTMTSCMVYDHTVHTYTYSPVHGEAAARLLTAFLEKYPDLEISERLVVATSTGADNEYAIEVSQKEALEGGIITQEEALKLANRWASGSTFEQNREFIASKHAELEALSPQWNRAATVSRTHQYPTKSSLDSGPKEFRIAEAALKSGQELQASTQELVGGIRYTGTAIPALNEKIKEFIEVTLDGREGDPDQLREDVLVLAKDIYKKNFKDGYDVETFKWAHVVLWTLLGAVAGGAAGVGADIGIDLYRRRKQDGSVDGYTIRKKGLGL